MSGFAPGIPAVVWFSRRTTQDEKQAGMIGDGFFPNFSLMSVNGVLTWIRRRIFIKVCVRFNQIELKEMDPAASVHRDGNTLLDSEGASTHSGPPSPKRRQMYDVKPGRATICLPLLPEDQNVWNAMLAKAVGVWVRPSAVVENMLGQLTESRGRNEDRL